MVKNEQTGEIQAALYSSELGGLLVALANSIQLDKRMEVLSRGVLGSSDTELYAATKDHGNVTIVLSNNDTSSRTFELHQVSDGGSSSDSNLIGAKGASIAVGAYWGVRGIPLPSGESMRGLCSSASAVSYTVWGTPGGSSIPNIEIFDGPAAASSGDVVGPGSSTDNAVARFDSTTGKIVQDSGLIVNDAVELSGLTKMTLSNTTLTGSDEFGVETGSILKFYDGSAKRRVALHTDAAPTDTQILVSNGTILQAKTVSGDATLANTGALTLAGTISSNVNFTGAIKLNGVTYFNQDATPTANAAGDRWTETDTNIEWFWNGTYWLSTQMFEINPVGSATLSGTASLAFMPAQISGTVAHDLFIVSMTCVFNSGSAHTSVNNFDITFNWREPDGTNTILATISTDTPNLAASTWTIYKNDISTYLNIDNASGGSEVVAALYLRADKNASAPNTSFGASVLYRWAHL